jgi:2-polyprenyl-3-methyl-5-hydroxy-6-metoxy-1,4-benzoquinol methylase
MRQIPASLLQKMASQLKAEDRDEMAIPSYLHRNPALRWMAWRRLHILAQLLRQTCRKLSPQPNLTVMDFGCGSGVLFEETGRHASKIIGVDLVLEAARLLIQEWNLRNIELCTPEQAVEVVREGELDLILAAEVLEHVEPLDETLERFATWLAPRGQLLVSLPTESGLYRLGRRLAGFEGHYHHSNAASIDRAIRNQGFRRLRLQKVPAPGPLAIYWIAAYASPSCSD